MLKVLSLFSGIGAFEKALTNLSIPYDLINYCEIDKYASKSYSLIHGIDESKNLWDVKNVDDLDFDTTVDLITYGFPCQDISIVGKQQGFIDEEGNITRSGLFYEALRIINDTKPKYAICENVKMLVSDSMKEEFNIVLRGLKNAGYTNYYKVLKSSDYGIPQKRERVFIVSIRNDIDTMNFTFPTPQKLTNTLKDIIDLEVDEKYYFSKLTMSRLIPIIRTKSYSDCDLKVGYVNYMEGFKEALDGIAYTILARDYKGISTRDKLNGVVEGDIKGDFTIRRLTPKEYFRLQGFDDNDYHVCHANGISDTQLYKQTGNSITVNVLMAIFVQLGQCYDDFKGVKC